MKKKGRSRPVNEERVVDPKLLRSAQEIVFEPKPLKTFACQVCGSEGAHDAVRGSLLGLPAPQDQRLA